MKPIKETTAFIFIIIAVVFITYYDSFNNSFIWDDQAFVVENRAIQTLSGKSIISYFLDRHTTASRERLSAQVWRPLVTTSFALDYRLWQLNPRWYHAENTLLHAANAVLVFLITLSIVGNSFAALFAALVFSIHPVQTQAVTWVSGRANVLFLLFFLLSLFFHIRNRKAQGAGLFYNLSLICFTMSLLSKEMAITLPLVCILYDVYFYERRTIWRYLGYYSSFFIVAFFYLIARFSVLGCIAQRESLAGGDAVAVACTMMKAIAGYVRLIFIPANLRAEYLIDISHSILDPATFGAVIALTSIVIVFCIFRRQKDVSFYILWFFVTLIPVYNIIPINTIMDERFLYLPSIAFASLFGMLFFRIAFEERRMNVPLKGLAVLLCIAALIIYGMGTISRNIEMRNELTFYAQEVERSPKNSIFHYNLGNAYFKEAPRHSDNELLAHTYYVLAIQEFKKSISLKPDNQWAYINMADAYRKVGLNDEAIENYTKAIAVNVKDEYTYAAHSHLGMAYYNKGMYDKAIDAYKKALLLNPSHRNTYINLGNAYLMKGEYRKARVAWSRALKVGGPSPDVVQKIEGLGGRGL